MISPFSEQAETCQIEYLLAIEWATAADGIPVGYDDGAQYDAIQSTITARISRTAAKLMADDIAANGGATILQGSGYLLGPTINTAPGVPVRIVEFSQDQPADSSQSLVDVTAILRYGPLQAPSGGALDRVLSIGVPYVGADLGNRFFLMEDGSSSFVQKSSQAKRNCKWYAGGLTTHEAAETVEALRTIRAGSVSWSPSATSYPFGMAVEGPHTVWIPRWKCVRECNLTWSFEMEIFRNG